MNLPFSFATFPDLFNISFVCKSRGMHFEIIRSIKLGITKVEELYKIRKNVNVIILLFPNSITKR